MEYTPEFVKVQDTVAEIAEEMIRHGRDTNKKEFVQDLLGNTDLVNHYMETQRPELMREYKQLVGKFRDLDKEAEKREKELKIEIFKLHDEYYTTTGCSFIEDKFRPKDLPVDKSTSPIDVVRSELDDFRRLVLTEATPHLCAKVQGIKKAKYQLTSKVEMNDN